MGDEEYYIHPLWHSSADALRQLADLVCLRGGPFGAFAAAQEGADLEHPAGGWVDSCAGEEGALIFDGVGGGGGCVVNISRGEGIPGRLWWITVTRVGIVTWEDGCVWLVVSFSVVFFGGDTTINSSVALQLFV